ncbi:MAG: hypothetical protein P9L94_03540 [Candidatus Hinthialibacter antarcticus]|nr:hypothetical protein [Candidatus Hinthialibacter antarcticus]
MVSTKWFRYGILALFLAAPFSALAQDEPQLPLTWEGEGVTWYIEDGEIGKDNFDISFKIDSDGWVTGKATTDEGTAKLQRFYYTTQDNGVRMIVIALVSDDEDAPLLFLMKGKVIQGKLFVGEVYAKAYEKDGKVESDLYLGSNSAVEITEEYMPSSLKSAFWNSKLLGGFKVEGGIK